MKEIIIAGAGLSGLTAAINLAKAGRKVVVHEQGPGSGIKYGGDFQGLENWSSKTDVLEQVRNWGINPSFPYVPFCETFYYDYQLNKYQVKWSKPMFYLVKRGSSEKTIDSAVLKQAKDLGVEVKYNSRVNPEEADIVATGGKGAKVAVVGGVFETNLPNQSHSILDDEIAPAGYAYFLVMNGEATIATCFAGPIPENAYAKTVEKFEKILKIKVPVDAKRFGGTLGFRLSMPNDNKIHVGESAGFQDYLWGFGMRFAMESGYLAAKSILEGISYKKLVKKLIAPRLKATFIDRYLYEKMGNTGYKLALKKYASSDLLSEKLRNLYGVYTMKHRLFYLSAKFKHRNVA